MTNLKPTRQWPAGLVDYRGFRLNKLFTPAYSHLLLLLFWPAYGLVFAALEAATERNYYIVHAPLDDVIPFCEAFVIPYLFWFVFLGGMVAYLLLFDVPNFKRMMYFVMLTYTTTCIIYILYPTMQDLRPKAFPRDNLLSRFMGHFYEFDTNTNVCPSLHVIGSFAALFGGWYTKRFAPPFRRGVMVVCTVLICMSTVFLKQHSVLDIPPALLLSAIGYWVVYHRPGRAPQTGRYIS